ncbi:hypothetical protein BV898_14353 [Hypsibius exemplaris]|uniref:Receptor ligand binding region domain-containing protein n=1 Tax=Hypsibius exemplaris TaxID=2072580 RepID=A0A9X6RJ99_HYPEX|nr:hypothetical protein BV898_14353 [Hypsibius exemplaris]
MGITWRFIYPLVCGILMVPSWVSSQSGQNGASSGSKQRVRIHFVQMIIGDRTTNLGYNLIGPAYDVALEKASRAFPKLFADYTVTRFFVPGIGLSCAESAGTATEGFYTLLANRTSSEDRFPVAHSRPRDFRIVLSPEADVPVLASSSSVPTPERFPSLLALSATSYSTLARAVAEVLRRFGWIKFNLLCDRNPDPSQIQSIEVICALILSYAQTRARELSAVVSYFDSSRAETIGRVLSDSRQQSTVNVLASYTDTYQVLLVRI